MKRQEQMGFFELHSVLIYSSNNSHDYFEEKFNARYLIATLFPT